MTQNVIDIHLALAVLGLLGLILLDWLLGALVALQSHSFDIHKLPGQLESMILKFYVGVLALWLVDILVDVAGVPSWAGQATSGSVLAAAGAVAVMMVADIGAKIATLSGGSPPAPTPPAP